MPVKTYNFPCGGHKHFFQVLQIILYVAMILPNSLDGLFLN